MRMSALAGTSRRTLGGSLHGHDNHFHLLRMVAAVLVLVSHSWPLTGTAGEPLERLAGFSLGHLGVDVFFVLSGFLVTRSLVSRPSLGAFVRARALRILPALTVNAWLTAFVLGAFVTTWPLGDYLTAPGTWLYALRNSVTWPLGVVWDLPGVFETLPVRSANGALWSLPWELTMYAMLTASGVLLHRTRAWSVATFTRALALLAAIATLGHGLNEAFDWTRRFEVVQALRLVALFTTAGVLHQWRDRVPMHPALLVVSLAALATAFTLHGAAMALYPPALAYTVLWLGLAPCAPLSGYARLGDFSYGFYLWQFPVQQWIVLGSGPLTPGMLALLAFGPTLVLAVLSWHLVEKPMLALKDRRATA
jgi:peptidoglycan/LPS O-acetylase OafA/YrhL